MNDHSERYDMNCDCFLGDGLKHHHIFYCPICGTPTKNVKPAKPNAAVEDRRK
ncbi:hypothetical protein [Desulfofustis limnaeus]|uniref:Uncharacterized protein n=1 Tax=Desulfofustis limnaeus TaxID=2740163 RepID=A0ABM7W535_9BACT|nr:hypothetical protein [Desulfofustis limnaeus]BDD85960.1 hypothetical protein DPPLL_03250 [Desulfofustis limnaeus]